MNAELSNLDVRALAINPLTGRMLHAGTLGGGVFGLEIVPPDHFLCYRAGTSPGTAPFVPREVELVDRFEAGGFRIGRPVGLCVPAEKDDEGINDPDTHLEGYEFGRAKGQPRHVRQLNLKVKNQFHPTGELSVDTIKPDGLLVPAAKCIDEPPGACPNPLPPPEPAGHAVDHYKCYRVVVSEGKEFTPILGVAVGDQFTNPAKLLDLKKPTRLCAPADRDSEGIKNADLHLMCYEVKPARGQARRLPTTGLHVSNEFGEERLDTTKEQDICVPSEIRAR
jgi:hypothetical protein